MSFHDAAGGENIVSSGNNTLGINSGGNLNLTAPLVRITTDTLAVQSANSTDPQLLLTNTTNDSRGAILIFHKDKGAAAADNFWSNSRFC